MSTASTMSTSSTIAGSDQSAAAEPIIGPSPSHEGASGRGGGVRSAQTEAASTQPPVTNHQPSLLPKVTRYFTDPTDPFGELPMRYPAITARPTTTAAGTPYFRSAGVSMLAAITFDPDAMAPFLGGFCADLDFAGYREDEPLSDQSAALCKTAGQLCYLSLGPKRSMNAEAQRYIDHIRTSGHGSVFEHANFTFLFYGMSRSLTHELVRHRAGFAYSQVSQRYVSGKTLRFVERPEFQQHHALHAAFESRIDRAAQEYDELSEALKLSMRAELADIAPTDRRKAVNQASRCLLPNETEAPIIVTANARAWRHFLEMRGSQFAEPEIRSLAVRVYACLLDQSPLLFSDYRLQPGSHSIPTITTETAKV